MKRREFIAGLGRRGGVAAGGARAATAEGLAHRHVADDFCRPGCG